MRIYELEGLVYVVPEEFAGRRGLVYSGCRGQFFWHINDESCMNWLAESYFENDVVAPEKSAMCKVKLLGTILQLGESTGVPPGGQFAMRERGTIVAVGKITKSKFESIQQG